MCTGFCVTVQAVTLDDKLLVHAVQTQVPTVLLVQHGALKRY